MTAKDDNEANPPCSETVYTGTWGGNACSKPSKVRIGNKWYCTIHDPARVAARRQASADRYEEERRAARAERERLRRESHTCNTCGLEHDPR